LLPVVGETVIAGPTVIAAWTIRFVFASVMVSRYVPANRLVGITIVAVFVKALVPEAETVVLGPNRVGTLPIKSTPPNVAVEIADRPVIVMVTLAPDAAVAGATIDGVPITVMGASAVSLGLVAANRSV